MEQLRLALSIISGRVIQLSYADYELLGYDTDQFGYWGKPEKDEILEKCENIVCESIEFYRMDNRDIAP